MIHVINKQVSEVTEARITNVLCTVNHFPAMRLASFFILDVTRVLLKVIAINYIRTTRRRGDMGRSAGTTRRRLGGNTCGTTYTSDTRGLDTTGIDGSSLNEKDIGDNEEVNNFNCVYVVTSDCFDGDFDFDTSA